MAKDHIQSGMETKTEESTSHVDSYITAATKVSERKDLAAKPMPPDNITSGYSTPDTIMNDSENVPHGWVSQHCWLIHELIFVSPAEFQAHLMPHHKFPQWGRELIPLLSPAKPLLLLSLLGLPLKQLVLVVHSKRLQLQETKAFRSLVPAKGKSKEGEVLHLHLHHASQ